MRKGVGAPAVALLLLGTLGISTAYGMLLLLPLYVQELGGDEASFGVVLSSAAVPAMLCIGVLIRHPERLRPHAVVAIAVSCYGLGAAGAALVSSSWTPLIGIGVLLGTAWAVVYTAAPMVMSSMVTDEGRTRFFGYLTGTQQVGIGAGPIVGRQLVETPLGFRGTFVTAGVVCAVAVVLTLVVGALTPDVRADARQRAGGPSLREAVGRIARSEAAFSLAMILLFACLFTSMTQFQTTFADARGLNYSLFYLSYSVAVIFSRFVLAGLVSRRQPWAVIAVAVSVMAAAVAAFLAVGSNPVLYVAAAAVLGLGYGLALPAVQAQAVNLSEAAVRPRVLPLAGLLFQGAVLAFPLAAGAVIANLGYGALFVLLVVLALTQAAIAWSRLLAARRQPTAVPA